MIYCRSDAACLCLSCDRIVHSANALSKRHSRTLVCERCNSQPAIVRCVEEKISLCQNCDWGGHATSASGGHQRQTINCYSGCPSSAELSRVWSFFPSISMDDSSATCEQGFGSMSLTDHSGAKCETQVDSSTTDVAPPGRSKTYSVQNKDKSSILSAPSSVPVTDPAVIVSDRPPPGSMNSLTVKVELRF